MLEVASTRQDLHRFAVMHRGHFREIGYQVVPRDVLAIQFSDYNRDDLVPAATAVESCGVVRGGVGSYDVDAVIVGVVEEVGSCGAVVVVAVAVAAAPAAVVPVVVMGAGV